MKVFIAGPRAINSLDEKIKKRLTDIVNQEFTVLVGDADGVDNNVQQFFNNINYKDVLVYASKGIARNNIGNWSIENVEVKDNVHGFNFYAAKDIKMAEDADYGFMIWNGESKGTLNNIINLTRFNKKVILYFTPHKKFYCINNCVPIKGT